MRFTPSPVSDALHAHAPQGSGLSVHGYWHGASRRRYVMTVVEREAACLIRDAVVVVAWPESGTKRAVWAGDSGASPGGFLALPEVAQALRHPLAEVHVHLLPLTASERQTVLRDLGVAAGRASSAA